jgi:hypothetical protein
MKNGWIALACAFFAGGAVIGEESSCQLPHGLFERRSTLVAEVGAYQYETDRSKELQSINEKYFQFMSKLEISAKPRTTQEGRECCEKPIQDPIADLICTLATHLRTERKQSKLLLESVPTSPRGREALWALDEIAHLHASDNTEKSAVIFGPYGPVTLYLEELYRLVRSGNEEAFSKYLELYPYSDGEHAEQMDDQMQKLVNSDLDLVLREWDIFKRHRKALLKLRDSLSGGEKKRLKSKLDARQECANRSSACAELADTLLKK